MSQRDATTISKGRIQMRRVTAIQCAENLSRLLSLFSQNVSASSHYAVYIFIVFFNEMKKRPIAGTFDCLDLCPSLSLSLMLSLCLPLSLCLSLFLSSPAPLLSLRRCSRAHPPRLILSVGRVFVGEFVTHSRVSLAVVTSAFQIFAFGVPEEAPVQREGVESVRVLANFV